MTFHAQLGNNVGRGFGQPLVLDHVYNNNGNAYDSATGVFTAPRDGTYFFIATTGENNKAVVVEIMIRGVGCR